MDAAIKALQDELEKQAHRCSARRRADKKEQEILKKQRERQAYLEDGQADLQRMKERAEAQAEALNNEFQQRSARTSRRWPREKGVDILLTSQVALTVNQDFDISKDDHREGRRGRKTAAGHAASGPRRARCPAGADAGPSPK